jgi:polyhydroxyalkanoate synthase
MRPASALVLAAALAATGCSTTGYIEPLPKEATHFRAKTSDGWELALVRYLPQEPTKRRPVLLCHGVSANDRNMDLDARHSIARWLAAQGREAWTMSLRGNGLSDKADPKAGRMPGYTIDEYWKFDLPAAIAKVREVSGAQEIDFIGHSMGGIVLYAYLSQGGGGIAAAVTMGSPIRLDWGNPVDPVLVEAVQTLDPTWRIPSSIPAVVVVPATKVLEGTPVEYLLINPRNTTPETFRRLMVGGADWSSVAVLAQLSVMIQRGFFGSSDGTIDFRKDMARVHVPVLVIAAKRDRLAVMPGVKDGYRALGGPKEWLIVGEENGAEADYGHMDLVIGERAATEVWPRALDFLDRHAAP